MRDQIAVMTRTQGGNTVTVKTLEYAAGRSADVYGDGSGPAVLFRHGMQPEGRAAMRPLATAVAALGANVYVPNWNSRSPIAAAGTCWTRLTSSATTQAPTGPPCLWDGPWALRPQRDCTCPTRAPMSRLPPRSAWRGRSRPKIQ